MAITMDPLLIIGIIVILIIVFILLWFFSYYNRVIRYENQIDNAWAQIDVQLKRRADLIPNLMETVKGYMNHERGTLEAVTKARSAIMTAKTPQESIDADNMLTGALKTLFAVAESYPDLKANQNFLQLQDELTHTEDKIAYSRQHFNDTVLTFNNTIETFPGNIFANMMGKKERQMLQIPEASKEVPKVSF
jgi:LemA protein